MEGALLEERVVWACLVVELGALSDFKYLVFP